MSCGAGGEESAIAKNITFTTSKVAFVLPNDLSDIFGGTCIEGGITGPRVRLRATIKWVGEGDLLPLVIRLEFSDSRVDASYAGVISAPEEAESLATIFDGLTTDFIPPGNTTYATTTCFLDYQGFPKPNVELKGSSQLEIPVTLTMMGVVRDADGNDTPFTKETTATITYVAGSIPID